jgi:SAM-dependent methyltransferase
VSARYAYDHGWEDERVRLDGLEVTLDPGTRELLTRLGVGRGKRCLEVGAGGGSVAFWLAERVAPNGVVVATDLEIDFLAAYARATACLEVIRHDVTTEELPNGFDVVHARWLVEWLPEKRVALQRMIAALRPGGVLLIEDPDFITIYNAGEPAVRSVMRAAMAHLEATCPVDCEYGRRALGDLIALGLVDAQAEGRCPIVRGGSPMAAQFLRLTVEKLREPVLARGAVSKSTYDEAVAALEDPGVTIVAPMTVAAWGHRP